MRELADTRPLEDLHSAEGASDQLKTVGLRAKVGRFAERLNGPTVGSVLAQSVVALCNLGSGILAARMLDVNARGVSAAIVGLIMLLIYSIDLGVTPAVQYFAASRQRLNLAGGYARWILVALTLLSVFAVIIGPYILLHEVMSGLLVQVVVIAVGNLTFRILAAMLLGEYRISAFNWLRVQQSITTFALVAILLTIERSARMYITATALAWAVSAVLALYVCVRWHLLSAEGQGPPLSEFMRYALGSHVSNQNVVDTLRLDIVIASTLLPMDSIARLSVASAYASQSRLLSMATSPLIAIHTARTRVDLSGADKQGMSPIRRVIAYGAATMGASVIAGAMAPTFLPAIFGERYTSSANLAIMYCISAGISGVKAIVVESVRGLGRTAGPVGAEIIGAIVFLGLLWRLHDTPIHIAICVLGAQSTVLLANIASLRGN